MKLNIKTPNPTKLKADIFQLIQDEDLKTWSFHNSNGIKHIKHTQQWGQKGFIAMTADSINRQLVVEVLKLEGNTEDLKDFEGYYLGRFCEILFVNFPENFTSIEKRMRVHL